MAEAAAVVARAVTHPLIAGSTKNTVPPFFSKRPVSGITTKSRTQQLSSGSVQCHSTSSPADKLRSSGPLEVSKWKILENSYVTNAKDTEVAQDPEVECKGWREPDGSTNHRVVAKLQNLAAVAADRSEMHQVLAVQRDNWNHMFHVTLSLTTITSAALSSMHGALHSPSLAITAFFLDAGAAGILAVLNQLQPSQLAEEQRTAARFFKKMATDLETNLLLDPRLREQACRFLEDSNGKLRALDKAFPLPLLPVVLPKFPKVLEPSVLSPAPDMSAPEIPVPDCQFPVNGWTPAIAEDLKKISQRLRAADGDVQEYLGFMQKYLGLNKIFAFTSPLLAALGAAASLAAICVSAEQQLLVSTTAAVLSVMAAFTHGATNAFQLGMVFELYRNCAGFYMSMDSSIQRSLRLPVEDRMDGELFHQQIAYHLGRPHQIPLLPEEDKLAGRLF